MRSAFSALGSRTQTWVPYKKQRMKWTFLDRTMGKWRGHSPKKIFGARCNSLQWKDKICASPVHHKPILPFLKNIILLWLFPPGVNVSSQSLLLPACSLWLLGMLRNYYFIGTRRFMEVGICYTVSMRSSPMIGGFSQRSILFLDHLCPRRKDSLTCAHAILPNKLTGLPSWTWAEFFLGPVVGALSGVNGHRFASLQEKQHNRWNKNLLANKTKAIQKHKFQFLTIR